MVQAHVESVHWAHSVQPIAAAAVCDAQLKVMGMSWAWRHASRAPLEVRNGNLVSSTAFARQGGLVCFIVFYLYVFGSID